MAVEGQFPRGSRRAGDRRDADGPGDADAQHSRKKRKGSASIRALDPKTLEKKWEFKMSDITWGGVLTTASDLLFSGGKEGYFFALDARTGAAALEERRSAARSTADR